MQAPCSGDFDVHYRSRSRLRRSMGSFILQAFDRDQDVLESTENKHAYVWID